MLFTSIAFKETEKGLEIIVKPGQYAANISALSFYFFIYGLIDFFALWLYFSNGAGAIMCFGTIVVFTIAIAIIARELTRELYREHIHVDKDTFQVTLKKVFGVKKVTRYKRSGIFDLRMGNQHIEGTLLFTYDNKTVRFCRMLHPEDAPEAYEQLLRFFNKSGHFLQADEDVIEVEPEEIN